MTRSRPEELFLAYIDGELSVDEASQFRERLDQDVEFRKAFATYQEITDLERQLGAESYSLSDSFDRKVMQEIRPQTTRPAPNSSSLFASLIEAMTLSPFRYAGSTAFLVLIIFTAVVSRRVDKSLPSSSIVIPQSSPSLDEALPAEAGSSRAQALDAAPLTTTPTPGTVKGASAEHAISPEVRRSEKRRVKDAPALGGAHRAEKPLSASPDIAFQESADLEGFADETRKAEELTLGRGATLETANAGSAGDGVLQAPSASAPTFLVRRFASSGTVKMTRTRERDSEVVHVLPKSGELIVCGQIGPIIEVVISIDGLLSECIAAHQSKIRPTHCKRGWVESASFRFE